MHAAFGKIHTLNGVHISNDCVQRQRLVRRQPRIHRLKTKDALQAIVFEKATNFFVEFTKCPHLYQAQTIAPGLGQIQHRVVVGVDERRHLGFVQTFKPVAKFNERISFDLVGKLRDFFGHRLAPVAHHEFAAVLIYSAIHRVDFFNGDKVGHVGTCCRKGIFQ